MTATTSSLEQRIAAIEAELAGLQGSEALQPNYLTVNPNGTVSASFTGQVTASGGLNINAASNLTPPSQDRIRWIRQSDGAVIADLAAYSVSGGSNLQLSADSTAATDISTAWIGAKDHLGNYQSVLKLEQDTDGTFSIITANVGSILDFTFLDSTGKSGFLRTPQQATFNANPLPPGDTSWTIPYTAGATGGFDGNVICTADTGFLTAFKWRGATGSGNFNVVLNNPTGSNAFGTLQATMYTW